MLWGRSQSGTTDQCHYSFLQGLRHQKRLRKTGKWHAPVATQGRQGINSTMRNAPWLRARTVLSGPAMLLPARETTHAALGSSARGDTCAQHSLSARRLVLVKASTPGTGTRQLSATAPPCAWPKKLTSVRQCAQRWQRLSHGGGAHQYAQKMPARVCFIAAVAVSAPTLVSLYMHELLHGSLQAGTRHDVA